MPDRIQLSRAKGWRLPPNTVVVARPSIWGNPFTIADAVDILGIPPHQAAADTVARFRLWLDGSRVDWFGSDSDAAAARILARLPELRGKTLACWCKPGTPCHADVLIELANG
jgi:hypothetical protein